MIYSNRFINLISLFFTILIFLFLNLGIKRIPKISLNSFQSILNNIDGISKKTEDSNDIEEQIDYGNWYIEIPSINLKAPIKEGTLNDILNKYVGHFEETGIEEGNVGLAGHNRGYEKNYFENLKYVNLGDEIIYKHSEFERKYSVKTIEIIENTNWNYLEPSAENTITLITCIENEPKFRRCVQAVEANY